MNNTKKILFSISVVTAILLTGCAISTNSSKQEVVQSKTILETYSNIALDSYTTALNDAKNLQVAINEFSTI